MLTLVLLFGGLVLIPVVLTGIAISLAARKVGAEHVRLRFGIVLSFALWIVNTAINVGTLFLPAGNAASQLVIFVATLVIIVGVTYAILQRACKLSVRRTLAPFLAYIGVNIGVVVAVLVLAQPFVFESFVQTGRAMVPAFEEGDRFFANKLLSPRRCDVVVFRTADEYNITINFRVVGMPGEKVRFESDAVLINDQPVDMPANIASQYRAVPTGMTPRRGRFAPLYAEGETIQLEPDEYFLLGDNVDGAMDSRFRGPVAASQIEGVIDVIMLPLSRFSILR